MMREDDDICAAIYEVKAEWGISSRNFLHFAMEDQDEKKMGESSN